MKVLAISLVFVLFAGAAKQDDLPAKVQRLENERRVCRARMMVYANANMAFRVKTRDGFTSNLALLDDIVGTRSECPSGGRYTATVGVPEKSFTMHCSVLSHDAGELQPPGFSPGVNTDFSNPDAIDRRNQTDPTSATCRANLATFSNAEIAQKISHGAFATDLSLMMDSLQKLPVCPEGGSYSVVVGVPKDSFTIHCSIRRHDAGMLEPRGYSPGLNTR